MMLDAALLWASKGFAVFPCVPLGKEPATSNGHKDATTDEATIRAWWSENPHYNIGVSPAHSGMFVLDTDPPRGEETLASLELEHGLVPATLTFRSPRGGFHRWFRGRCPSSVGTEKSGLGPKLDTRGYGGYVLLPPSRVKYDWGTADYQCTDDREIADGPVWISEVLARKKEQHSAAAVDLDLPVNVARAENICTRYVEDGDVAIEGSGGDDRTYRLACEVLNMGLSPTRAFDIVRRIWNPACIPPWDEEELAVKIRNAAEYSQNDAGAWAVADGATTFADYAAAAVPEPAVVSARGRYFPYEITDVDAFVPPDWIIPDLIPKRGTVQVTGPQKSFKTFLVLDMALSVAAGVHWCGVAPAQGSVVYIAGENASALALKHVPAWCLANSQDAVFLPFRIVREMPHAAFLEEMTEFITEIKRADIAPSIVVIDTATRALRGLDENNARDMGQFSAACEMIQRELDCTVIVIRHTGKDVTRGGRGSNVIEGDFDTILAVERQQDEQERKTMFCTLSVREQRNAAEREQPFSFEMTPLGQSLVPRPISKAEHDEATRIEDPFSRQRIGAALVKLGAIQPERGLSTYVLATELTPPLESDGPEAHDAAVKRVERTLRRRAKQSLAGYCSGEGSGLTWFVVPQEDAAHDQGSEVP